MERETLLHKRENKKTDKIPDSWGHYDIDGVSQTLDFDVVVASDEIGAHKPPRLPHFKAIKLSVKRWVDQWKEED